jgi:choline dehydrogenase-like flavoprotein
VTSDHWDCIVIGSGFGGSTVALELASAGRRVLVLERGGRVARGEAASDPRVIQVERRYRSTSPFEVDERWGRKQVYADAVVGGNSVFYGAASLRLRPEDFDSGSRFDTEVPEGISVPRWPVDYDDLEPYYGRAEHEIGVAGIAGSDPYEPPRSSDFGEAPPPYGSTARMIANAAEGLGLRPFPLPLTINFSGNDDRPKCVLCMKCDLFPCVFCSKNDMAVTLLPRAEAQGAIIRERTIAKRLIVSGGRVKGVECLDLNTGEETTVSADLCVVSCGALASAGLLLASGLEHLEPNGKLIGRYLMRHCSGIVIGMFPFKTNPEHLFPKQVAITDFYHGHASKKPSGPWGVIQALQTPPPEYILHTSPYPAPVGRLGVKTLEYQAYLLCLAEDLPNRQNFVDLDPVETDQHGLPIVRVFHKYVPRDLRARRALYREAGRILRKAGSLIRFRLPIHTYSHAVGTTRFGADPADAVLDPWCRLYGVQNLFVVDGGFMPTSGGVNPSLTIAANGFRVGRHIADNWNEFVGVEAV